MEDPSDRDLLERTLDDDDLEAYGDLVRRYQTSVFSVCYRLMGERQGAEDMAQETFMRAYARLETFDLDRPFGPWIRRVAANLCYNELRSAAHVELPLDEERDPEPKRVRRNPEQVQLRSEQADLVAEALRSLPAHHRAVIELRHYHELSYKEISRALGMTMSEVKTNLYRARNSLAEILGKENDGPLE